jgi:hypothetical protein
MLTFAYVNHHTVMSPHNTAGHYRDESFMGITWAVSTTDSMLGPYVVVVLLLKAGLARGMMEERACCF